MECCSVFMAVTVIYAAILAVAVPFLSALDRAIRKVIQWTKKGRKFRIS